MLLSVPDFEWPASGLLTSSLVRASLLRGRCTYSTHGMSKTHDEASIYE